MNDHLLIYLYNKGNQVFELYESKVQESYTCNYNFLFIFEL